MIGGASLKFGGGGNFYSTKQQCFLWDTASQKHEMTSYARNLGDMAPPWLRYARECCLILHSTIKSKSAIKQITFVFQVCSFLLHQQQARVKKSARRVRWQDWLVLVATIRGTGLNSAATVAVNFALVWKNTKIDLTRNSSYKDLWVNHSDRRVMHIWQILNAFLC